MGSSKGEFHKRRIRPHKISLLLSWQRAYVLFAAPDGGFPLVASFGAPYLDGFPDPNPATKRPAYLAKYHWKLENNRGYHLYPGSSVQHLQRQSLELVPFYGASGQMHHQGSQALGAWQGRDGYIHCVPGSPNVNGRMRWILNPPPYRFHGLWADILSSKRFL